MSKTRICAPPDSTRTFASHPDPSVPLQAHINSQTVQIYVGGHTIVIPLKELPWMGGLIPKGPDGRRLRVKVAKAGAWAGATCVDLHWL
jgi:hypothetical protein